MNITMCSIIRKHIPWDNLSRIQFKNLFKLIKGNYTQLDVFIEVDANAERVWEKFRQITEIKDRFLRKEEY